MFSWTRFLWCVVIVIFYRMKVFSGLPKTQTLSARLTDICSIWQSSTMISTIPYAYWRTISNASEEHRSGYPCHGCTNPPPLQMMRVWRGVIHLFPFSLFQVGNNVTRPTPSAPAVRRTNIYSHFNYTQYHCRSFESSPALFMSIHQSRDRHDILRRSTRGTGDQGGRCENLLTCWTGEIGLV